MSVVWVVYGWWSFEGGTVAGVFDSEEGANAFIARERAAHGKPDPEDPDGGPSVAYPEYEVQRHEVQAHPADQQDPPPRPDAGGEREHKDHHLVVATDLAAFNTAGYGHMTMAQLSEVGTTPGTPFGVTDDEAATLEAEVIGMADNGLVEVRVHWNRSVGDIERVQRHVERLEQGAQRAVDHHLGDDPEYTQWLVMRQDDNGNIYEVARVDVREEAEALAATYESRGHKQLYWVEAALVPGRRHKVEQTAEVTMSDLTKPYSPSPEVAAQLKALNARVSAHREQLQQEFHQLHGDLSHLYFRGHRRLVVEDTDAGPRLRPLADD